MLPERHIFSILGELEGRVGLYLEDLDTGDLLTINPDRVFPSASTIKIVMYAALMRDVEAGRLSLDDEVEVTPENRVGGTGVLKELHTSIKPTIRDLATLMIILSDNAATNQIIDLVGIDRINDFARELGLKHTLLQRKMMDLESARAGKDNFTSAGDMGSLLRRLARGEIVSPEASVTIVDAMKRQQLRNKLPALLPSLPPYDPAAGRAKVAPGTVVTATKTGDLYQLQHDVGIFYLPHKTYVLAVLTNKLTTDAAGIEAIQKISLAVYRALTADEPKE